MSSGNPLAALASGGGLQELKQRLLFVLFGLVVFRIGSPFLILRIELSSVLTTLQGLMK